MTQADTLSRLESLVRQGYATGRLIPVDEEYLCLGLDTCKGCALTAAYLADTGKLPVPQDEDDGDDEVILTRWARGLGVSGLDGANFIKGFDGYVTTNINDPYYQLGVKLRSEFILPDPDEEDEDDEIDTPSVP